MVLFPMQSHDFFENFLFNRRQFHFPEPSCVRLRDVNKKFVAFVDVTPNGWTLDGAGHFIALVCSFP